MQTESANKMHINIDKNDYFVVLAAISLFFFIYSILCEIHGCMRFNFFKNILLNFNNIFLVVKHRIKKINENYFLQYLFLF